MLFVSNVAFCFPAVKDPASIRNAISGFRFDLGQVATSLSLPIPADGAAFKTPCLCEVLQIWPNWSFPPFASLHFTHPHQTVLKLLLRWISIPPLGRGYTESCPKYLQHTLKEKDYIEQSV